MRRFIGGFILGIVLTWAASCASSAKSVNSAIAAAAIAHRNAYAYYDVRCEHLGGKIPPSNCKLIQDTLNTALDAIHTVNDAEAVCEAKQKLVPPVPCTVDPQLLANLGRVVKDLQAFVK